jgi:hypothetical protein
MLSDILLNVLILSLVMLSYKPLYMHSMCEWSIKAVPTNIRLGDSECHDRLIGVTTLLF